MGRDASRVGELTRNTQLHGLDSPLRYRHCGRRGWMYDPLGIRDRWLTTEGSFFGVLGGCWCDSVVAYFFVGIGLLTVEG